MTNLVNYGFLNGCMERDKLVLNYCKQNNLPIQISKGGGYSPDINTIVERTTLSD